MPENRDPRRADWSATYYHRADASGIGYDRTRTSSNALDLYRSPLRERWSEPPPVRRTLLVLPTTSWPRMQAHIAEVMEAVSGLRPGESRELTFRA